MSLSRKQALNELQNMFPTYDRSALNTLLRANDNMLNQTIDYILQLNEEEQKKLASNERFGDDENKQDQDQEEEDEDEETSAFAEREERKQQKRNSGQNLNNQSVPANPGNNTNQNKDQISKEEEEKRSRELIDQLLAQEMQEEYEIESAKYQQMVQENMAIEGDLHNSKASKNNSSSQSQQQRNPASAQQPRQLQSSQNNQQKQNQNSKNANGQQQQQQKKPDQSISDKAEKTVNKMGAFFKKTMQKIEDQLNGPSNKKGVEENKSQKSSVNQQRSQNDQKLNNQRKGSDQNVNYENQNQQVNYSQSQVQHNSNTPLKQPKEEFQKEIIEEIIFHHPDYTSPSTYFKSIMNGHGVKVQPGSLNQNFDEAAVEEIDFGIPAQEVQRRNNNHY